MEASPWFCEVGPRKEFAKKFMLKFARRGNDGWRQVCARWRSFVILGVLRTKVVLPLEFRLTALAPWP
jgi:hypothetical protein